MKRLLPPLLLALLGLAAIGVFIGLALAGAAIMPSYLAAWLFWLAMPVGALPLLMGLELAGRPHAFVAPMLRRLLVMMPLAALLSIPILFRLGVLYSWEHASGSGLSSIWFTTGFFDARMIVFMLIWVALALVFLRPPAGAMVSTPRRAAAVIGLMLHFIIGTFGAYDWARGVDPQFGSSLYGLLLISAQCGIALSAAILLTALTLRDALTAPVVSSEMTKWLLALLGIWVFMHFTQFLVVWSGDLPRQIVWYQQRSVQLGAGVEWFGFSAFLLPLLVLLPRRFARDWAMLTAMAALVLLAHLGEMLWLITPTFRQHFIVWPSDAMAMLALGVITAAPFLIAEGIKRASSAKHKQVAAS